MTGNKYNLNLIENFKIIDIEKVQEVCAEFVSVHPFPKDNQLCFLNTQDHEPDPYQGTGNKLNPEAKMYKQNEENFTVFNPMWEDTILHDLYERFPKPITRMRLMQVNPKSTYSIHKDGDNEIRYHIAVKTNEHNFFMYADTLELIHVPLDGNAYEFDVERPHSFINFSLEHRWHLVLNAKLL